jgi:hypothetical protein
MRHRFTNQQKPPPADSAADDVPREKISPEIRAERRQLRQDDASRAWTEYAERNRGVDENTHRLRALRLAREERVKTAKSKR